MENEILPSVVQYLEEKGLNKSAETLKKGK